MRFCAARVFSGLAAKCGVASCPAREVRNFWRFPWCRGAELAFWQRLTRMEGDLEREIGYPQDDFSIDTRMRMAFAGNGSADSFGCRGPVLRYYNWSSMSARRY